MASEAALRLEKVRRYSASLKRLFRFLFVAVGLALVVLLKLNFHLIKLFGFYADGKLFSHEIVAQIRRIGVTVLLFPVLWVLGVVASAFFRAEQVVATVVGSGQHPFTEIIVGTIIIVVAWIMDVGRELREDQDLLV